MLAAAVDFFVADFDCDVERATKSLLGCLGFARYDVCESLVYHAPVGHEFIKRMSEKIN